MAVLHSADFHFYGGAVTSSLC